MHVQVGSWRKKTNLIKNLHLAYSDFPFHYRLLICSVTSFYFSFSATSQENLENYRLGNTIKLVKPREVNMQGGIPILPLRPFLSHTHFPIGLFHFFFYLSHWRPFFTVLLANVCFTKSIKGLNTYRN